MNDTTQSEPLRSGRLFGSCCFNCKHWSGLKKTQRAYCLRLNLSGKDAPHGTARCVLWEKRTSARMPNTQICRGSAENNSHHE
jgi:hypothetical protein